MRLAAFLVTVLLVVPSAARTSLPSPEGGRRSTMQALARSGLPLWCGGRHGRYVALTFDDGPGPYTPRLLRILSRAGARATFFVIGSRVPVWPESVRVEMRRGAVGNHTWSHRRLAGLGRRAVVRELLRTQAAVVRAGDGERPLLFRPPYGVGTPTEALAVHALGLVDVRWSVDSRDAIPGATPASIVRTVAAGLIPGAIVLLHDNHPATLAALPRILRIVRRRHLTPVTVPELVALDPPSHAQLVPVRPSGRCP